MENVRPNYASRLQPTKPRPAGVTVLIPSDFGDCAENATIGFGDHADSQTTIGFGDHAESTTIGCGDLAASTTIGVGSHAESGTIGVGGHAESGTIGFGDHSESTTIGCGDLESYGGSPESSKSGEFRRSPRLQCNTRATTRLHRATSDGGPSSRPDVNMVVLRPQRCHHIWEHRPCPAPTVTQK